jgi:phage FluMu gp28-like protein
MSEATEPTVVASAPLEGAERDRALNLVEEIQETRGTNGLKPSEVPNVLLPYQARWHEDKSAIRLARKARRVGFSWGAMASESVVEAATSKTAGGMDQHYMGYNQAMAAEFIGDCAFFAKAIGTAFSEIDVWRDVVVVENERRDVLRYKIMLASGFRIEALSSNPYNWRGKQGHARIDEAAFHDNLREVVKGALAFRMWGGRVDIVSTFNGENNDFTELCRDVEAGKLPWSMHTVTFDDALGDGFFRRVCLIKDKPWSEEAETDYRAEIRADYPDAEDAAEELDCIPKRGTGAYFTRMIIEQCWDESLPVISHTRPSEFVTDQARIAKTDAWIKDVLLPVIQALPKDRRTALGRDFGRSGDLSVDWVLQEDENGIWRTAFILEQRNIPFDVQLHISLFILRNLPLLQKAFFDARGNGQSHAETAMQEIGAQFVECVMLSTSWYAEWFPKYRAAYEAREIRVPKSEDIVQDHRLVVLRDGRPAVSAAKVKGSDGKDRHGDTAVAGVLAYAAACGDGTQPAAGATADPDRSVFDTEPNGLMSGLGRLLKRPLAPFSGRSKWL